MTWWQLFAQGSKMLVCGVDKAKVKTYVVRIYLLYVRISPIKSNFFPRIFWKDKNTPDVG